MKLLGDTRTGYNKFALSKENLQIDEMAEIRGEIQRRETAVRIEDRNLGTRLLQAVREKLSKRIPVKITEEMRELGVADTIQRECYRAEGELRLHNLMERGFEDREEEFVWEF